MLRPFTKIKTSDGELDRVQDELVQTLAPITRSVLLNGNLLRSVSLAVGSNNLSHGLGRNYQSYFVGQQTAASTITPGVSPDRSKYIALVASAATTVDLLVL